MTASTAVSSERIFHDPPFVKKLFGSTRWAWLWLIVRLYVGYQWLTAGWHKIENPDWMSGQSLQGFWTNAIAVPEAGRPPITYDWYRSFLEALLNGGHYSWFGPLVAYGELIVGICLIIGLLTGIAAFFGAFMNFNFMLAGTASTNPVLFLLAILLMLAWKIAGWWGLDRWVLPALGTPWEPGEVFEPKPAPA
jgi:thiosulfate dehydrogenase [quinone] large subunit